MGTNRSSLQKSSYFGSASGRYFKISLCVYRCHDAVTCCPTYTFVLSTAASTNRSSSPRNESGGGGSTMPGWADWPPTDDSAFFKGAPTCTTISRVFKSLPPMRTTAGPILSAPRFLGFKM